MLKIETELLEDHQAKLVVTVPPERLQREMLLVAQRLAQRINIPGFRKGKAPHQVVRRYIGDQALLEEALEPLGQAVYAEALDQTQLDPYAEGELTDLSIDPLVMTFTVPLVPDVDLGNYREVRVPFDQPQITDQDVETVLRDMLAEQAVLEPVERAVAMGDAAMLEILGTLTDEEDKLPIIEQEAVRVLIAEESTYPIPGFPQQIVGMSKGESRDFSLDVPNDEDYVEEIRGKTMEFHVICKEVFRRELPELNDEFAQSVGDYESLAALRESIRAQLAKVASRHADDLYANAVFEQLEPLVTVKYPPIMLAEQIDSSIENFDKRLREQGLTIDEYLKLNNLTMEQLREDFREPSRRALVRALILGKLIEVEGIVVTDEEIEDEIQTMTLSFGSQAPLARQLFSSAQAKESISRRLLAEKASLRLLAIARGEAPELTTDQADAEPDETKKPKKSRAKVQTSTIAEASVSPKTDPD